MEGSSKNNPGDASDHPKSDAEAESPELRRLKAEKALLDQQTAVAKARQDLIAAILPSDVKPLEGSLKIDGDHPIEALTLAYEELDKIAKRIAEIVRGKSEGKKVVVHSEPDLRAVSAYQAFSTQLKPLLTRMKQQQERARSLLDATDQAHAALALPSAGVLMAGTGAVMRSAIDLLSLFRADVSMTYKDVTINDLALVAAVTGALADSEKPIEVYDPTLVSPEPFNEKSALGDDVAVLFRIRSELQGMLGESGALQAEAKKRIEELTPAVDAPAADKTSNQWKEKSEERDRCRAKIGRLASLDAAITATIADFDAFRAALLRVDEKSAQTALEQLLRGEKLCALAKGNHLLLLKVAAASGGYKTKRTLWRGTRLFFNGGAIANYMLFDANGMILAAGTQHSRSGFVPSPEP